VATDETSLGRGSRRCDSGEINTYLYYSLVAANKELEIVGCGITRSVRHPLTLLVTEGAVMPNALIVPISWLPNLLYRRVNEFVYGASTTCCGKLFQEATTRKIVLSGIQS